MGEHHFLFSRGSLGVWPEEHTTEPSCIIPEPGGGIESVKRPPVSCPHFFSVVGAMREPSTH